MAKIKTETVKEKIEQILSKFEQREDEFNHNHRRACTYMVKAMQALDRVIRDEQAELKQGKEYFDAITPVTGKTKLKKS